MAAGAEVYGGAVVVELEAVEPSSPKNAIPAGGNNVEFYGNSDSENSGGTDGINDSGLNPNVDSKPNLQMKEIVDMLKKLELNPMAKEFFPSSYCYQSQNGAYDLANNKDFGNDGFPNYRKRRNNYNQGKKRMSGRAFKAQREESIKRTVYVSDIDHNISEEQLAALFSGFGQVADCRICGDPHSNLRFAFVEFSDEYSARGALALNGAQLGFSTLKVLPSKTAILPVNPIFLPQSEDECEMCARTVYCTNIDKKISQVDVKIFFESRCGEVSRLRLLGDHVHSTRIAFVEFVMAESALLALDCCGEILGSQRIRITSFVLRAKTPKGTYYVRWRVSPSKTPVRPQVPRPQ